MVLMCHLVRKAEHSAHAAVLEAQITKLQNSLTEKKQLIAALERKKQSKDISSFLAGDDSHDSLDCGHGACDCNTRNTSTSTSTGSFEEDENLKFRLSHVSEVLQNIRAYRHAVYPNETRNPSTPRNTSGGGIAIVVQGRPFFGR